jgi:hypothetical protein
MTIADRFESWTWRERNRFDVERSNIFAFGMSDVSTYRRFLDVWISLKQLLRGSRPPSAILGRRLGPTDGASVHGRL